MLDDRDRYHPRTIEELAADPIPVTLINETLPPDNVSTLGRAKQRSLHAVPVAPGQPGSDRDVAMSGAADAAAKSAMELLDRLNKGKTAA